MQLFNKIFTNLGDSPSIHSDLFLRPDFKGYFFLLIYSITNKINP